MKRWMLIAIGIIFLIAIFFSYRAGKSNGRSEVIRQEMSIKIDALSDRLNVVSDKSDSILLEYTMYKLSEASRLEEIDSIVQSYQKQVKSLQWSVNGLKKDRNELQNEIDSLTDIISLPDFD